MWLVVHSILLSAACTALLVGANPRAVAMIVLIEGLIAFVMLLVEGGVPARRPANVMTTFRLLSAILGLATVAAGATRVIPWVFWIFVAGEVSDFLDGLIARTTGPTAFGARLDMETDAFFVLVLALLATSWHEVPRWVVVAGMLRYTLAVPFLLLPDRQFPRSFSVFAKIAAATAAISLLVVLFPRSSDGLRLAGTVITVSVLVISFGWEAILRVAAAVKSRPGDRVTGGILRSFVTYYGVPFRLIRMKRFYRSLVKPGTVVFDIGAHVGNRIRVFRSLGATVIAVEPQAACVRVLERFYGDDAGVMLEAVACGANNGVASLKISPDHPTLATLSDDWIESIDHHYGELDIRWDQVESTTVRTLDDLIDQYGNPSFIKIDVEGFEAEALRGLSREVPVISFEFLPASIESALESIDEIGRIGRYLFNHSMVESMRMQSDDWLSQDEMKSVLTAMQPKDRSGDIYARVLERP